MYKGRSGFYQKKKKKLRLGSHKGYERQRWLIFKNTAIGLGRNPLINSSFQLILLLCPVCSVPYVTAHFPTSCQCRWRFHYKAKAMSIIVCLRPSISLCLVSILSKILSSFSSSCFFFSSTPFLQIFRSFFPVLHYYSVDSSNFWCLIILGSFPFSNEVVLIVLKISHHSSVFGIKGLSIGSLGFSSVLTIPSGSDS